MFLNHGAATTIMMTDADHCKIVIINILITMTEEIREIWPELEWISDKELREKTARPGNWPLNEVFLVQMILTSFHLPCYAALILK